MPSTVQSLIIAVAQQMLDEKERPKIMALRKEWRLDDLTLDQATSVVQRVADAAKAGVSVSLTSEETNVLYRSLLDMQTHDALRRMNARRVS
jgi:hypothetical protein